jgi:hypothetical protein
MNGAAEFLEARDFLLAHREDYGSPAVGKTLSARHYANWENVQSYWNRQCQTKALLKKISKGTVAFYTSPVVSLPGHLEREIAKIFSHSSTKRKRFGRICPATRVLELLQTNVPENVMEKVRRDVPAVGWRRRLFCISPSSDCCLIMSFMILR